MNFTISNSLNIDLIDYSAFEALPSVSILSSTYAPRFIFGSAGDLVAYSSDYVHGSNPTYSADPSQPGFPTVPYDYALLGRKLQTAYQYVRYLIANCGIRIPAPSYGCPPISCWTDANSLISTFNQYAISNPDRFFSPIYTPPYLGTVSPSTVRIAACRTSTIYRDYLKKINSLNFERKVVVSNSSQCATITYNNISLNNSSDAFMNILLSIIRSMHLDPGIASVQGARDAFWKNTDYANRFWNISYPLIFDQQMIKNIQCIIPSIPTTSIVSTSDMYTISTVNSTSNSTASLSSTETLMNTTSTTEDYSSWSPIENKVNRILPIVYPIALLRFILNFLNNTI